jgi:hypothetical protein
MNKSKNFSGLKLLGGFLVAAFLASSMLADGLRTQSINLYQGWNAVYLQVTPTNANLAACFQGTPVTIVASHVGNVPTIQYLQDPNTNTISHDNGWSVWYAPDRPDAFLTSLFALNANNGYLIYAQSDFTWSVTGTAVLGAVTWKPNSFNLVGFCLDDVSPPTFDQFFSASAAQQPYRIYRLVNNQWVQVASPQSTQMRSGEACWIYCTGASSYQGPLNVALQNGQSALVNGTAPCGVLLANNTANPLNVTVANTGSSVELPLAYVLNAVTSSNVVATTFDLPDIYPMQVFEANESRGFWLTLRPEKMTATNATTLLKITTDLGTQTWLPVTGNRSEL